MEVAKTARRVLTPRIVARMREQMTQPQRLRWARHYANLSLDGLAEKVGTSRQHLIRLEKGLHKPKSDMVARIAEHTGVPAELVAGDDDEASRSMSLDDFLRARIAELLAEQVRL